MNLENIKFDFDDILIQPKMITTIKSRYNYIDPMYAYFNNLQVQNHYPIFTAPMDTVVDLKNMKEYMLENIGVVLPRTITRQDYLKYIKNNGQFFPNHFPDFTFMSFSLNDFENYYIYFNCAYNPKYVLIDTANGHLKDIFNITKRAKEINPNLIIMIGNIANPETYQWYCENSNVDLIRIGVGNGAGCLTTQQTGTGFPKASLIHECYNIKKSFPVKNSKILPKIVADGGMKDYSDIIKALALGCFLPTSPVNTVNGVKSINNIKVGDEVITHKLRKKKVLDKFEYDYEGKIVNINGIYSTPTHEYFVVHKKYSKHINENNLYQYGKWISAIDLTDDYLLIENNTINQHPIQMFLKKMINRIYIYKEKILKKIYKYEKEKTCK